MFSTPNITTASDKVYFALRQAIVCGEIEAGSKLSEPELAKSYQVSRATLREAINRLENCHLIERKANIGARVVSLSLEKLTHVYQVRIALEGLACRLAALHMTEQEIEQVHALLNEQLSTQQLKQQQYYQEEGDLDFHYKIILGSKNDHLIQILCHELYLLVRMFRVQWGMSGPRVSNAFIEHKQIIEAIAKRDGELAELLMKRHIQASQQVIEDKLHDLMKTGRVG